jgi:hypothetical protein
MDAAPCDESLFIQERVAGFGNNDLHFLVQTNNFPSTLATSKRIDCESNLYSSHIYLLETVCHVYI